MTAPRIRALISVSDKTGIVELARNLAAAGVELVSTGGTASLLRDNGLDVTDVSDVTGQPEAMDGRLKTLHPRVFGGLLARPSIATDLVALDRIGGEPFQLVVVNLYPFRETIARPGCTIGEAVEQIDIGGPSMIRAAAKNHRHVAVVVDPADYDQVTRAVSGAAFQSLDRFALAAKAFRHTAAYDAIIAQYLTAHVGEESPSAATTFPEQLTVTLDKVHDLRYGENPHQAAALYALPTDGIDTLVDAHQHQGKELSYNNIGDADAALAIVREFSDEPAAVIVKHANPCGVAIGATALDAWNRALETDPISAFGGIVAFNREVDEDLAAALHDLFLEVVIAPAYTAQALEILATKPNLRVLELRVAPAVDGSADDGGGAALATRAPAVAVPSIAMSTVSGGMLLQQADTASLDVSQLDVVTEAQPTDGQLDDLRFAWSVVKHVASNAIVLATDGRTVGVGAGQMNRVGSVRIAVEAARSAARGSVLASDAFFPMPDSIDLATEVGITAIIQPGGSKRDPDVIAACNAAGIAMVFTGVRHFRH